MGQRLQKMIKGLFSGYFAAVMATGIVSIALFFQGQPWLSGVFLDLTVILYCLLTAAYAARAVFFPTETRNDLMDAGTVFNYFTFVAGSDVLGTRLALAGDYGPAWVLGGIGLAGWFALIYYAVLMVSVHNVRPEEQVINGGWLVATVGAESLTVLATSLAPDASDRFGMMFAAYALWAIGVLFYIIFIAMILHRFFYYPLKASDLQPNYWINMGAVAITTLAGSRLADLAPQISFLRSMDPFLEGVTSMLWSWGTWWIPALLLIGAWKYFFGKDRFVYHPALWSMVFPLGMYTVATQRFAQTYNLAFLLPISEIFLWVAFFAWVFVAIAGVLTEAGFIRRSGKDVME